MKDGQFLQMDAGSVGDILVVSKTKQHTWRIISSELFTVRY